MKLTFDNYKDILNKFNTFNEHDIGLVESLLKDAYEYSTNGIFPDALIRDTFSSELSLSIVS